MTDNKAAKLEAFCNRQSESTRLLDAVLATLNGIGQYNLRIGKSQVAFRRRVAFAWVWMPRVVLRGRGAPLVLTVGLHRRDGSSRWKQIVEPYPGRFTHHLELWDVSDLDEEVRTLLSEAWNDAG